MEGLTEGRIVHYCFLSGSELLHRAAIIVKVWNTYDEGTVNLTVFPDWTNDIVIGDMGIGERSVSGLMWKTSVKYSKEPEHNTWHWIEKA